MRSMDSCMSANAAMFRWFLANFAAIQVSSCAVRSSGIGQESGKIAGHRKAAKLLQCGRAVAHHAIKRQVILRDLARYPQDASVAIHPDGGPDTHLAESGIDVHSMGTGASIELAGGVQNCNEKSGVGHADRAHEGERSQTPLRWYYWLQF